MLDSTGPVVSTDPIVQADVAYGHGNGAAVVVVVVDVVVVIAVH